MNLKIRNKIPRTVKLKTFVLGVGLTSVIFLALLNLGLGGYIADQTKAWFTQPLQEASYIIGEYNSTHYYARNHTGYGTSANKGYEMLSTNASVSIKYAVGNASLVKGSVLIKAGDYPISPNIDANFNNTVIMGEGKGTRLYLPDGQPLTKACYQIFDITNCENVTIQHLCIDGNYLNNDGDGVPDSSNVWIRNSRHITMQNCYVINARAFGVNVVAYAGEDTYDVNIVDCDIIECKWNGIQFYTAEAGALVHDCVAERNYVSGSCDIGMNTFNQIGASSPYRISFLYNTIDGSSDATGYGSGETDPFFGIKIEAGYDILIEGNMITTVWQSGILDDATDCGRLVIKTNTIVCYTSLSYAGIRLDGANNCTVDGNRIFMNGTALTMGISVSTDNNVVTDNYIVNEGENCYGIISEATADNNVYTLNNLMFATIGILIQGTGEQVYRNLGFVTEFFGTAEASDTDAISFGITMAGVPQTVIITVNENDARYIAMAYDLTTTDFNLYLWDDTAGELETTDKTISYTVIYKP